jgi:glutathione synthase/RimK-type ligase-like ATP-grasp enzyme
LHERSVEPVLVDAAKLESVPYTLFRGVLTLYEDDHEVRVQLRHPTRGWIRRLAPPDWRRSVQLGSEEAAVRGAWASLVTAIAGSADVTWLTPLDRLFLRENKLLQEDIARRKGIPTPATTVVSSPDMIHADLGDTLAVKPLGAANYLDRAGTAKVVWAQTIDRGSSLLDRLGAAPFLLQARLEAERHLRAVTVGRQSWVCELAATDTALDWRQDDAAHDSFVVAVDPTVERDALRISEAFGVGYSSQDWVVTREGTYFLDLNPAGQWLFLPTDVASAVTAAIATWLTS